MKAIIKIFVPICILSFIAFGISVAVLGTKEIPTVEELLETEYVSNEYTFSEEEFENVTEIIVEADECNVTISPSASNSAKITVYNDFFGTAHAKLELSGADKALGIYRSSKLFKLGSTVRITAELPQRLYDTLDIEANAGLVISNNIEAQNVSLEISGGGITYLQPENAEINSFSADVAAGALVAEGVRTKAYSVDVSAGLAKVYGLTGSGEIDVSAGSARLGLAELSEPCSISVSGGKAIMVIPEDAAPTVSITESLGGILIKPPYSGDLSDGEVQINGGGEAEITADISAGKLEISTDPADLEDTAVTSTGEAAA